MLSTPDPANGEPLTQTLSPDAAGVRRLAVVGLGYIGLPTAAVFADRGWTVIGIDVSEHVVDTINRGAVHIVEPDLDAVVARVVERGVLRASLVAEPADAFLIAVPTPFKENYAPDLRFIEAAAATIAPVLKRGDVVVLESTSPVGAAEQLADWLATQRPDLAFCHRDRPGSASDVHVAYCPERVLPGNVVHELVNNDRVIGGLCRCCSTAAADVYRTVVAGECVLTDARTAELCKLTENSFRDVNIAFANELSLICDRLDIDVWELIRLANRHPRVNILQPGPGVGGHCIAVDPWFIVDSAPEQARLIRTARVVNDGKPDWVVAKVEAAVAEATVRYKRRARIACLGLAFKANIDDLRESPALTIAERLAAASTDPVMAVEPHIAALPEKCSPGLELTDLDAALDAADVVVLLVDHAAFRDVDPARLAGKAVIDTRGLWRINP